LPCIILTPPWRPADVEQREGRILRHGNTNTYCLVSRFGEHIGEEVVK